MSMVESSYKKKTEEEILDYVSRKCQKYELPLQMPDSFLVVSYPVLRMHWVVKIMHTPHAIVWQFGLVHCNQIRQ